MPSREEAAAVLVTEGRIEQEIALEAIAVLDTIVLVRVRQRLAVLRARLLDKGRRGWLGGRQRGFCFSNAEELGRRIRLVSAAISRRESATTKGGPTDEVASGARPARKDNKSGRRGLAPAGGAGAPGGGTQ